MKNTSLTLKQKNLSKSASRHIWYWSMILIPILQFLIFYVYVNLNTFILAFRQYDIVDGTMTVSFSKLSNFTFVINFLKENAYLIKNSLTYFLSVTVVELFLSIIFAYYICKKFAFSKFFQVILFLPNVLSHVVLGLLFYYITMHGYPYIVNLLTGESVAGLFQIERFQMPAVIIYNIWIGFGTNVLLFATAMNGVNPSIIEAAEIDGVNLVQELFRIRIPCIFNTFITFTIISIAFIFTTQMNLYTLFETSGPQNTQNVGYYMFVSLTNSDLIASGTNWTSSQLAALGLMITIIIFPIAYSVRYLLKKYGPSAD